MPKAPSLEESLAQLHAAKARGDSPQTRQELSRQLAGKTSLLVAKAAALVGELHLTDLAADLPPAFDRFLSSAPDKGCAAKTAVAQSLNGLLDDLGPDAAARVPGLEGVFLRGIRHVQHEPSWGGSTDVAGELRATCALALSALGHPALLSELADLLADADPQCRGAAARALAHAGQEVGADLLRLRLLCGETQADVASEYFTAMLRLAPARSLPLVARYLDAVTPARGRSPVAAMISRTEGSALAGDADADAFRQAAVTALGSSRLPAAFDLLRGRWEKHVDAESRKPLLPAFALMRLPRAFDFLVEVIDEEHRALAVEAIKALRPCKGDDALRERVREVVDARNEPEVSAAFREVFAVR